MNSDIGKNTCFTQKQLEIEEIKVKVYDRLAEQVITILSLDKYINILEKAAQAMRRPNHLVEIGYEAPLELKDRDKEEPYVYFQPG